MDTSIMAYIQTQSFIRTFYFSISIIHSLNEIDMNEYKILGRIGQGAHGYVMKGLHRTKNQEVALKKLIIKSLDEGIPKNIMREILALRVLKSEYVSFKY